MSGVCIFQCSQVGSRVLAASWSDQSKVHIWDLTQALNAVNDSNLLASYNKNQLEKTAPIFTFTGHQTEGFAMDWSKTKPGNLFLTQHMSF